MNRSKEEKVWIIQRCTNAFKNQYENWIGYCEKLMTHTEMIKVLNECNDKWPYQFRGHKVSKINKKTTKKTVAEQ